MKNAKTRIDNAKFQAIIEKYPSLTVTLQSCVKIEAAKNRRMYLASGDTSTFCDLSGFVPEVDGILTPENDPTWKKNGAIMARIDFSRPEEEILATFELCLIAMIALPPRETIRTASSPAGKKATGWSFKKKEETSEESAALA